MEELSNKIVYDFNDLKRVSRYLDYANRRVSNIIPVEKSDISKTFVTGLQDKYLTITKSIHKDISEESDYNPDILISPGDNISFSHHYTRELVSMLSEAGVESLKEEFNRAKELNQEIKIICVLDEQCNTFLTRRKTRYGNIDIPFSFHALYGEWKYGDKNNIKNLPLIEEYLKYIEEDKFKTSYIRKFMFLHLSPSKHLKAKNELHDAKYIIPILVKDKKSIYNKIDNEYIRIYVENSDLYNKINKSGYEIYASNLILNNMNIRDKFDVDVCLEIRHGSPINKPKRLYMLNMNGIIAARSKEIISNRNKSDYLLHSCTLLSPEFLNNKDDELKRLMYNKVIAEGKRLGMSKEKTLKCLAIVIDNIFKLVNLDENYNYTLVD